MPGQPADRAEGGGAGLCGARPPLVVIAVADDSDAITAVKRVMKKPLKSPPGRVNFDGAFETAIMREIDVGVAAPDMGDDDGVFVAAVERLKQLMGGVAIFAGGIGDQNPRGAADRSSFRAVKDIAVPTHAGIARPCIDRQGDKTARHVELAR